MDLDITKANYALKNDALPKISGEKEKVAQDFEAIFLRQMLNDIYKSDSDDLKAVRSMQTSNLADLMSRSGGIGISRFILENWRD